MYFLTNGVSDVSNADKSDDKVEHLNTIWAQRGGNLNDPIFKSSNDQDLPGGKGVEVSN